MNVERTLLGLALVGLDGTGVRTLFAAGIEHTVCCARTKVAGF